MQERKRIAVIMNESESVYQQRMLKGIITQAYSLNWDVAVFSCLTNYYCIPVSDCGSFCPRGHL